MRGGRTMCTVGTDISTVTISDIFCLTPRPLPPPQHTHPSREDLATTWLKPGNHNYPEAGKIGWFVLPYMQDEYMAGETGYRQIRELENRSWPLPEGQDKDVPFQGLYWGPGL